MISSTFRSLFAFSLFSFPSKKKLWQCGIVLSLVFIVIPTFALRIVHRSHAASTKRQSLTFEDRVAAQRAIEEVYHRHRLWPRENPQPKPPLDEMLPEAAIRAKVEDYLRKASALETYWQRAVTPEELQAEMDRMARDTRQPDTLRELWEALGNDPMMIAECLARPLLAERLSRNLYSSDERFHGELKRQAEAELNRPDAAAKMRQMSGEYREIRWIKAERTMDARNRIKQPGTFLVNAEQWQEQINKLAARVQSTGFSRVLPQNENSLEGRAQNTPAADHQLALGQLSGLQEDEEKFYAVMVMEKNTEHIKVASVEWKKMTFDEWWNGVRSQTNSDLIAPRFAYRWPEIQAAQTQDDGMTALMSANVPSARDEHTAVWTGSEMIVWGGLATSGYFNTGGRYDPATDSWTVTNTTSTPSARSNHTAVWTGSEMIVWGGYGDSRVNVSTGGRYNPVSDSWTPTSNTSVPTARSDHTAVWTGSEMIVWGGFFNTGGRYKPATDTWVTTSNTDAPSARVYNTAVWTGSEMIVWGGYPGVVGVNFNTGGRYNPATDSWKATSTTLAPSARFWHTAVWTGSEMIVWGGFDYSNIFNTGGRYNPTTDSWLVTSTAPSGRFRHTAVWTGNEMIVWGDNGDIRSSTGGRYNPTTGAWTTTSTTGAPIGRYAHSAIWTGSEMIVWGGYGGVGFLARSLNTGGRYKPATDLWVATNACTYLIVPINQLFDINGGNGSVTVSASGECNWTATSNANWITITSGSSGSGNGTVNFTVAASTIARTGTLTIAGQTFTVTQSGVNPAPTIASLSPNSATASGTAFTLTVTGTNFINGSIVRWNNTDRPTTFVSGTQLTAAIPASDIANAGAANVTVLNPTPGDGVSNTLKFTITPQGYEADVAPRPNGNNNGAVTITDWVQIGRFVTGVDSAANGSEFQRADCAPRNTLGDGRLSVSDWVQAGRYAAGLDPVLPAGGPTLPVGQLLADGGRSTAIDDRAQRHIANANLTTVSARWRSVGNDRRAELIVELEACGTENALGFSLQFDPGAWSFVSATAGRDAAGASLHVNASVRGRVGVALALAPGQRLAAGARQIVVVQLTARGVGGAIEFSDYPIQREVADAEAHFLPTAFLIERKK